MSAACEALNNLAGSTHLVLEHAEEYLNDLARAQQAILLLGIFSAPIILWLALVVPPALRARSWSRFRRLTVLVSGAMGFPTLGFFYSLLAAPMSKTQAVFGAVDSFQAGKFALLPLLLWSLAACYFDAIAPGEEPVKAWITLGLSSGFVLHIVWMGHALVVIREYIPFQFVLALLATPAWYGWRAYKRYQQEAVSLRAVILALLASLPFWAYSVVLSRRHYADLPETADCFVVTAASCGHHSFVGPWTTVTHRGKVRSANRQLATFWALESAWRDVSPRTHRWFRSLYGALGPKVARRINGPIRADVMFVLLKPLELCARGTLRRLARNPSRP